MWRTGIIFIFLDVEFGCKCGVAKSSSRIIGGNITEINEFPWLAGIAHADEFIFCGGALVSSQWVLTASHCLYSDIPKKPSDIRVILGEYDLNIVDEELLPRKVEEVSQILLHYYYDYDTMQNDIALLKLTRMANLNVYTPVCLPPPELNTTDQKAWVYGKNLWGTQTIHSDMWLQAGATPPIMGTGPAPWRS